MRQRRGGVVTPTMPCPSALTSDVPIALPSAAATTTPAPDGVATPDAVNTVAQRAAPTTADAGLLMANIRFIVTGGGFGVSPSSSRYLPTRGFLATSAGTNYPPRRWRMGGIARANRRAKRRR